MKKKASSAALIRYYLKPYPWFLTGVLISGLGFVLLETVNAALIFPMMNTLVGKSLGEHGDSISMIVGDWLSKVPSERRGLLLVLIFAICYVVMNLFDFSRKACSEVFARVVTRDHQLKVFRKVLYSDYQYLHEKKHGAMLFRVITAPQYMAVMFSSLPKLAVALLKVVAIGVVLLLISFEATLIVIGLGLGFYLAMRFVANRFVYRFSERSRARHEQQNVLANESLTGIREVKIRQCEETWIKKFWSTADDLCWLYTKNDLIRSLPSPSLQIAFMLCLLAIGYASAGLEYRSSSAELGSYIPLIAVYFYAFTRLAPSIAEIASTRLVISERLPYAEAVYDELHATSRRMQEGSIVLGSFEKEIRFENVSFAHPGRSSTLLGINIVIEKGKTTALVGVSGSGKSTISDLLVRLYDVDSGRIVVDCHDLRDLKLSSWLENIGYVSQEGFLFNASVEDNIAFGGPLTSHWEVEEAARAAGAHEFIMGLPQQYATALGDRGVHISGGQRQRIAMARALLHKPDILIFDEATSALDSLSEAEVQAAISNITGDHTVIVIAHRLSTVRAADKIVVLADGRVVEQGNHLELLSKRGSYYHLYSAQEGVLATAL